MEPQKVIAQFSANLVELDADNDQLFIHFGTMTCEQFVEMMSDVIARAAVNQFEVDPNDMLEWIVDRIPASVLRACERIN